MLCTRMIFKYKFGSIIIRKNNNHLLLRSRVDFTKAFNYPRVHVVRLKWPPVGVEVSGRVEHVTRAVESITPRPPNLLVVRLDVPRG